MPQTSLTAWLSKPAGLQLSVPRQRPLHHNEVDESQSGDSTAPASVNNVPPAVLDPQENAISHIAPRPSKGRPQMPPNVELRACTKEDIPHLKRLNSLLLPIPYQEKFYRETIEDPLTNSITLVAVWHDDPARSGIDKGRLVGAIRCRILAHPLCNEVVPSNPLPTRPKRSGPMLYLSTVVLLSPYRSHGIATGMLEILTRRAVQDYGVEIVGAHVWEANAVGLEWYRKRGFQDVGLEHNYYRRLNPKNAVVMQRDIGVMDLVV
ncbi:hypothetical protein LTR09_011064 [Extremus antarcticus]|uniref:N-acetyltransferase domain-containing protein n=1 Tax=Extremus antarcticus TaxID=702011 RepID=A0AAJ0DCL6_9PEZI|nr:hypothetical protein LTR09_011064 [Extremus antarcticus]